jgi:hypothetical protein
LAIKCHEISLALNIFIFITFWAGQSDPLDSLNEHQRKDGYVVFEMFFVHIAPVTCGWLLLVLQDEVFLVRDSCMLFKTGMIYIIVNGLGSLVMDRPVYMEKYIDWKMPFVTLAIGVLQALILYGIHWVVATVV